MVATPIELTGDWGFMLSTDGWWELLSEQEVSAHHSGDAQQWMGELQALVLARQEAGCDNSTAIAVSSFCRN